MVGRHDQGGPASAAQDLWAQLGPPLTFAVYDEGDGLRSLYLTPCPDAVIERSLDHLGHRTCRVIGMTRDRIAPVDSLALPTSPTDIFPGGSDEVDLLTDTHRAVQTWAVSRSDPDHAIVFSRDPEALRSFLSAWLTHHCALEDLPAVPQTALDVLLVPLPMGLWHEADLDAGPRLAQLEIALYGSDHTGRVRIDSVAPGHCEPLRWVGSKDSGWRTDWSW